MGGDRRSNMMETTFPQEPGTPPPVSGRKHCLAQTDIYLENIADSEVEFKNVEMQCEPLFDDAADTDVSVEPQPLFAEKKGTTTIGTQLDEWVFSDVEFIYEETATNLADCVIMESLKQLQEEYELEALRKQHQIHKCLRNREIALLIKHKEAQAKYEAQKRYLESRKPWEDNVDSVIAQVGFDQIRNNAPAHFIGSQTDQALYSQMNEEIIPPMNNEILEKLKISEASRNLLRAILEDTVHKREAEYGGKQNVGGGVDKKASLITGNFSDYEEEEEGGLTTASGNEDTSISLDTLRDGPQRSESTDESRKRLHPTPVQSTTRN